ncbi:MAG: hypothetical protein LQ339_002146 [Xanthoria mediterranea]|nr:MAG: hypothetical protein LQ339_002146 [Xanthoria mediterranea]
MAGASTEQAVTSVNKPLDAVACEAEGSTMASGRAATMAMAGEPAPFPFMKLPPELRVMVYNYHFFQPVEHATSLCLATVHPSDLAECKPGGPICRFASVNNRVHMGNLWVTSKEIYHEAMPIFFSTHYFQFASLETLGHFLSTIPHYHRQHITKLRFDYLKTSKTKSFDIQQTLRLLSECPNLVELAIGFSADNLFRSDRHIGPKTLLQVRGIESVEIIFIGLNTHVVDLPERFATRFSERISVLKEPYSPAETKRREARGISKETVSRTCFDGSEKETRAARNGKSSQPTDKAVGITVLDSTRFGSAGS